jgi:hypothetical protein
MYRFVVCVDVEAESLQDAYQKLSEQLRDTAWESTVEAYGPPEGAAIEAAVLQHAIEAVLERGEQE